MRRARIVLILVVFAVVGFATAVWLSPGRGRAPAPPAPTGSAATAPGGAPAGAPAAAGDRSPYRDLRIESSGTVEIAAAELVPGRPVVLHLVLGEPSKTDEPRPVRILAFDGARQFEGQGSLDSDRSEASFSVDPSFLAPGRYVVEVKTTELTHFPLRRYVVEVY